MNAVANVPRLVVRREINAGAEEIFDAWLDARSMAIWMRPPKFSASTVKNDPREGGSFEVVMHAPDGPIRHHGHYRKIDRPRKLVFTWQSPYTGSGETLVTVDFLPRAKRTEVVVTHEYLPTASAIEAHKGGWTECLESLANTMDHN